MKDNWTDKLPSLMEGYEEAAPEGLWDAVQAGVSRRKVVWWPWAAGLVAAAVVLAVFLWKPSVSAIPAKTPFGLLAVPSERLADVPRAPKAPVLCTNPAEPSPRAPEGPVSCTSQEESAPRAPKEPDPCTGTPEQPAVQQPAPVVWPAEPERPRSKAGRVQITVTSGGILLAQAPGSISKGYGVPVNPGMETPMVKGGITTDFLSRNRESTTETKHSRLPRISLGIHYEFAPRWSVGSGLTCSSLQSDYTTLSGTTETRNTRYLYYLGVPLNLQYRVLEWKRLALYLSAGPMVETAVGARQNTRSYVSGTLASERFGPVECKDWRWSLNAGAGLQLRLFRKGSLFVQPGVSWHFPGSGKVESYYSAHPLALEMDFGARWDF